jgi:hypothetical protein
MKGRSLPQRRSIAKVSAPAISASAGFALESRFGVEDLVHEGEEAETPDFHALG